MSPCAFTLPHPLTIANPKQGLKQGECLSRLHTYGLRNYALLPWQQSLHIRHWDFFLVFFFFCMGNLISCPPLIYVFKHLSVQTYRHYFILCVINQYCFNYLIIVAQIVLPVATGSPFSRLLLLLMFPISLWVCVKSFLTLCHKMFQMYLAYFLL